jgi:MarR family transcriptional regulator, organic hydroperoxide resistance regulator
MKKQEFLKEMACLAPKMAREFISRQVKNIEKKNLTMSQVLILEMLYPDHKVIMKHIADVLKISTPAVTGLVDKLEKMDYIARNRDSKDRRVIKIEIMELGIEIVEKIQEQRMKMIEEFFSVLDEDEREMYIKIIRKVVGNLGKANK